LLARSVRLRQSVGGQVRLQQDDDDEDEKEEQDLVVIR
jgi:hypothetical protein